VQPPSAITGIVLSFSVVPAAIIALSLWSFSRYSLRKADIDELAAKTIVGSAVES
jgi:Na+/melibiose symporter-like transporter